MAQSYLETTHHSVNWFKSAEEIDQLVIAPPFQRRPVWSAKQKSDLIGTILLGYPIPELYVHEVIGPDGDEVHRVVDGQQRIRAVLEFVNGDFALSESEAVPTGYHSLTFDELDPPDKKTIRSYKFVVRTLKDLDEPVVREMFRRLNQGVVALNDQELRHATYSGDFLKLVEEIADRKIWNDFGLFSADDVRRMRDVETISELAVAALNGPQNKKLTLDKWYQAYEEDFPERTALEGTFDAVVSQLVDLVPDLKKSRWRKRSDFYSLFGALARCEALLPLAPDVASALSEQLTEFADSVDRAVQLSDSATLGVDQSDDEEPVSDEAEGAENDESAEGAEDRAARAGLPKNVVRYADAVERAATDLSRRRVREQILVELIKEAVAAPSAPAKQARPSKTSSKKTPAKKLTAKKAPARRTTAKKAPAKKAARRG